MAEQTKVTALDVALHVAKMISVKLWRILPNQGDDRVAVTWVVELSNGGGQEIGVLLPALDVSQDQCDFVQNFAWREAEQARRQS